MAVNLIDSTDIKITQSGNDIRLGLTGKTGDLVVDSIRTKNLFGDYIILNGWLDNNTLSISSASGERLAFIPCKANTTYIVSRGTTTSRFRVGDYTTIPQMTSTSTTYTPGGYVKNDSASSLTYTTSASAKYLIIEYANINNDNATTIENCLASMQVEEGATATNFTNFQNLDLKLKNGSLGSYNTAYVNTSGYIHTNIFGNICIVSFNYNLKNNIPTNSVIVDGLPECKENRYVFIGVNDSGTAFRFYIQGNAIRNDGVITTGGWTNGNFVYPIK